MKALLLLMCLVLWIDAPTARAEKTRLETEAYVENSDTDYLLVAQDVTSERQARRVRVFQFPSLQPGSYTVLVFVDGRFFRREKLVLPGRYPLSIRGMSPGRHRVTLQVVGGDGRVGSVTKQLEIAPSGTSR